jgi:hypothetical protein
LSFDYEYLRKFEAKIGTARNVMYLCRTSLGKNTRKSASLPCPFKHDGLPVLLDVVGLVVVALDVSVVKNPSMPDRRTVIVGAEAVV